MTVVADTIIEPTEEYTPGMRVRPERSAVGCKILGVKLNITVGTASDAARYAMSRSRAHAMDNVDWRSNDPSLTTTLPPIEVPGETPILPVARVVTVPANVMAVPASTANVEQAPSGISTLPCTKAASNAVAIVNDDRKLGVMIELMLRS